MKQQNNTKTALIYAVDLLATRPYSNQLTENAIRQFLKAARFRKNPRKERKLYERDRIKPARIRQPAGRLDPLAACGYLRKIKKSDRVQRRTARTRIPSGKKSSDGCNRLCI